MAKAVKIYSYPEGLFTIFPSRNHGKDVARHAIVIFFGNAFSTGGQERLRVVSCVCEHVVTSCPKPPTKVTVSRPGPILEKIFSDHSLARKI